MLQLLYFALQQRFYSPLGFIQIAFLNDTFPDDVFEELQNWSRQLKVFDDNGTIEVEPKLINFGPRVVRQFIGELNFTTTNETFPGSVFKELVSTKHYAQ